MICLIGKTASGKDTIAKELVNKYGYKRIVTYTTRPIRDGEKEGVNYYYISKDEFLRMIDNDDFAEWKKYKTVDGDWYYGVALKDLDQSKKSILIVTPDGYKDIIDTLGYRPKSIYIYANSETIIKRLSQRGDSREEALRRIHSDNKDFKDVALLVDKIVYNNAHDKLDNVILKIIEYIDGGDKN